MKHQISLWMTSRADKIKITYTQRMLWTCSICCCARALCSGQTNPGLFMLLVKTPSVSLLMMKNKTVLHHLWMHSDSSRGSRIQLPHWEKWIQQGAELRWPWLLPKENYKKWSNALTSYHIQVISSMSYSKDFVHVCSSKATWSR